MNATAREFTESLSGKIYRLAPMPNFKQHMHALMALIIDSNMIGIATATAGYMIARTTTTYTFKVPFAADGIGYIEPLVYPGEEIEYVSLISNGTPVARVVQPKTQKIYFYQDTYIPIVGFNGAPLYIEVKFKNMRYSPEKRIVWIECVYLQNEQRADFINIRMPLVELPATYSLNVDADSQDSTNNPQDSPQDSTKKYFCPECGSATLFLERGLCVNEHTWVI